MIYEHFDKETLKTYQFLNLYW